MPQRCLQLLDSELAALKAKGAKSIQDRLLLAKALNLRGKHEEAAQLLDHLLTQRRDDGEIWFERLLAYGDQSLEEEGLDLQEQIETLRVEHPDQGAHLRNLGFIRLLLDDLDGAKETLEEALRFNNQDPYTYELRGLLMLYRDETVKALELLNRALELKPRDPRIHRLRALVREQMDDHHGAMEDLCASLEVAPCFYWGWHTLGELLLKEGDLHGGLQCIHRARSLHASEPTSYFRLSELLSEQGHLELAIAQLQELSLLAPPAHLLSEARSLMGEYFRDMGDRDKAQSYLAMACEMDPSSPNPWATLGDMAREDQQWDKAMECYLEALQRDPEAADLQVQLGYVHLKLGQVAEAELAFGKALESDPGEYSAYLGLSEVCRHQNQTAEQARYVEKAMALAPQDPDVWNARGVALEVQGQLEEATRAYEKALDWDPAHRKAANNLGFILEKRMAQGEPDLWERAVGAWKRRLLVCRDEGLSMKKAMEHLHKLGVGESQINKWLEHEPSPGRIEA